MRNEIKLQKNNDKRNWTDLEWIQEFDEFLQGNIPEGIKIPDENKIKLTSEQSETIIWYLQDHFPVFPDHIEMCNTCKTLFDSYNSGEYFEIEEKHYCDSCYHLSEATHCCNCGCEMWKNEVEHGEDYLCKECKNQQQKS